MQLRHSLDWIGMESKLYLSCTPVATSQWEGPASASLGALPGEAAAKCLQRGDTGEELMPRPPLRLIRSADASRCNAEIVCLSLAQCSGAIRVEAS